MGFAPYRQLAGFAPANAPVYRRSQSINAQPMAY
jgi:hypothetical protein